MLVSQNILILRCHRQTVSYDGFGRKIRVDYAQGPASVIGGDLPADGDYEVTLSRVYAGAHVFCDGRLEYSGFPGGYFDASGSPRYYITDWQGNNAAVVDKAGNVVQKTTYYPYGEPTIEPEGQRYLFGGKEREHAGGRNSYDFGARSLTPYARWSPPDPLADKFYPISPYSYCGGDPINKIDPDGLAWHLIEEDEKEARFEWVEPQKSYDQEGNLLPNHYEQAISFSREGSKGKFDFEKEKKYNIGTSTATVYKADGTTEDFDACTNPSDPSKYATVPEGRYEAKVGKHKVNRPGEYTALRMADVGTTNFYDNTIELGVPNPSAPGRTTAKYINIHKAGKANYTGLYKNNKGEYNGVSEGCILIDQNQWDSFINIFNTPKQKNNIIGIILLR